MLCYPARSRYGFSAVELLVVLGILSVLTVGVLSAMSNIRNSFALKSTVDDVFLTLRSARTQTLGAVDGTSYGVRIESDRAIWFVGSSYNASSTSNRITTYAPGVTGTPQLSSGTTTITFSRLTGNASATGTITLLDMRTSASSTLRIAKTGVVDIVQ